MRLGQSGNWVYHRPKWLEVVSPQANIALAHLDRGETEAITVAAEMQADVLLIDEYAGRREAVRRGLKVAGILSVLDEADRAGLVSFDQEVTQLRKTSFRVSSAVIAEIRRRRSL